MKFAEAIQDALPLTETKPALDIFDEEYTQVYKHKMRRKVSKGRKEGNVLFNNALNTFYLRLYGVRHIVKKPAAATWATLSD